MPPPASRPAARAPHRVCPACDPRQVAYAFNQPLDWNTSRVTHMSAMFYVRCSQRALSPNLQSRALSPARCVHASLSHAASRLPARSPPRTVCRAYGPWQDARAFNQPLRWDTSRVTNMQFMFDVRCAPRALPPNLHSRALDTARCVCTAIVPVHIPAACAQVESATPPTPPHFARALLSPRQNTAGGRLI